ncbi:hypothetical protein ACFW4X_20185 [Streptomyces smyrnaeus]|uniref:hypothetical protein n=1 Tax=Streptomyces smyrnaeus TaxID=1387713 RepID=UPI0033EE0F50
MNTARSNGLSRSSSTSTADDAAINDGGGMAGGAGATYGAQRAARLRANAVTPLLALGATLRQCEPNGQPGAVVRDRDGGVLAA